VYLSLYVLVVNGTPHEYLFALWKYSPVDGGICSGKQEVYGVVLFLAQTGMQLSIRDDRNILSPL
jgi:hypothetical protein